MGAGAVEVNITTNDSKKGVVFDKVDDFIEYPHNDKFLGANLADGFTISAWINPRSDGEGTGGGIVNKSESSSALNGIEWRMAAGPVISFELDGGTVRNSGTITLGVWTHILITVTAAQIATSYLNGVVSGTPGDLVKGIDQIITTAKFIIGNGNSGAQDRTFDGTIMGVKMWNKVLSSDEITLDASDGNNPTENLILHVPLQGDYDDISRTELTGTNSGTHFSIVDDAIAAAIKTDRTTANDKYLMVGMPGGQVVSAIIEEAP